MRTYRTLLAVAVAGLAVSNALADGGIKNSAHNFTLSGWAGNEICKPCHIPHGGNATAGYLWNHTLSTATYTLFDGSTAASDVALDRVSILCMSCHDGTVALDSFGGATGSTYIDSAPYDGKAKLGSDLRNDHPVGKTGKYTALITDTTASTRFHGATQSFNTATPPVETGRKVINLTDSTKTLSLYKMTISGADAWVVGCKTCHDPHNNGIGNPAYMLKFSNVGSDLCLTCHIK